MVEANRKKNSVPFPSRNGHENLKLVSMMGVNKWNSNFGLEPFAPGKQDYPFGTEKQTVLYAMRTHHEVAFTSYCVHIVDLHILLNSVALFLYGKQGQKN